MSKPIPKPSKGKKGYRGYSDSYLQQLWRKAVKLRWGNRCAMRHQGECSGDLECHHIARRGKSVLRNDYRNGVVLCEKHHRWMDSTEGKDRLRYIVDMDYVIENDVLLPEKLKELGMNRREFDKYQHDDLIDFIGKFDHE